MAETFDLFRHVARELIYTYMTEKCDCNKDSVCAGVIDALRETGTIITEYNIEVIESEFENALGFVKEDKAKFMVEGI